MKQLKTLAAVAALALALNAGLALAADDGNKGAETKAGKGAGKGKKGPKAGAGMQGQFKRIEDVLGKPLTEEQKTAITDAQKVMQESVAKALGLTPEEWQAKQKEYRAAHPPAAAGAKKEGDKPAAP